MKKILTILILLLAVLNMPAQENRKTPRHTLSGYITDAASGEPIIGAAVIDSETKLGAVTGNTGFYSISLPHGRHTLIFSYLGYTDKVKTVTLEADLPMNVGLDENNEMIANATVVAHRNVTGARSTQMSAIEVPINQIKAIPAIGGEVDIIKALQLLPGVQSGSEGSAGIYVRGGGADENLLLMDGVPLYNVNHLFGFFSVFNADAVKNVTLYKGSFPARFGGHLSSVIDVRMNDGNDSEYHGNVSIGLISSKFNFEGPIVKGRTTFNVSARRTYLDLLAKPLIWYANRGMRDDKNNYERLGAGYDFYDFNSKITHKFNNGDRLSLSFYSGDDKAHVNMDDASYGEVNEFVWDPDTETGHMVPTGVWEKDVMKTDMGWDWGNMVASLRWNHELTPKLYMSAAANFTRYRSYLAVGLDQSATLFEKGAEVGSSSSKSDLNYNSLIGDYALTADFDWNPAPLHDVKFGGAYTLHRFKPGIIALKMTQSVENEKTDFNQTIGDKPLFTNEASVFAEDNWTVTPWLKANLGVHASLYGVGSKTYFSAEPRISARALITDELSVKASYSEMSQYIHMLSNSNLSLPSDLWVPVTKDILPMRSRQVAAGVFYDRGKFEYSVEAYYKTMDNVLEYKDGASFFSTSTGWEEKVCMGRGWSYGIEFFVQKKIGRTTGWLGYTLATSMRQFDRPGMIINDGRPFPAKYDRRHDLSATVSHELSKHWDVSATFVFASGNRGSLAFDEYPTNLGQGSGAQGGFQPGEKFPGGFKDGFNISDYLPYRNNYRMPAYNRLDLGVNYKKEKKHGTSIWNLSVYNAYNRQNPFLLTKGVHVEYDAKGDPIDRWPVLKQISIFPIIPSISYTFKF